MGNEPEPDVIQDVEAIVLERAKDVARMIEARVRKALADTDTHTALKDPTDVQEPIPPSNPQTQ